MNQFIINILLLIAGIYIVYTIYETQIKNTESLQMLYPESFNENKDYMLNGEEKNKVIPFDSGIRVNYVNTCSNV
jgi:hypothetical protein